MRTFLQEHFLRISSEVLEEGKASAHFFFLLFFFLFSSLTALFLLN